LKLRNYALVIVLICSLGLMLVNFNSEVSSKNLGVPQEVAELQAV
jgi:hypothetical protein